MMNELIQYIDQIDQSAVDAEIDVMESLIQSYDKSIMIIQEASADTDLSAFDIFQEGEKWDKFKEDTKAPVLGNNGESVVKRLLMIIPRLISKVILLIRKTQTTLQNKRLLKKIEYIQKDIIDGKENIKMKYKGKLDKKSLRKLLKASLSDDFMKQAAAAGKVKENESVSTESYVIEAHTFKDDHDPIRDVHKLGLKQNPDIHDPSNREKLTTLIGKYNEEIMLSFLYDTIENGELRSKYNYRNFLSYLKLYSNTLKKIDERVWNNGDIEDLQLQYCVELLKGKKVGSNIDSGNVGQHDPFVESQYSILIPIHEYRSLMKSINEEIKKISGYLAHFQSSSIWNDSMKHPRTDVDTRSHMMHTFLDELQTSISTHARFQQDFTLEIGRMNDLVDFTTYFMKHIQSIMLDDYGYKPL